MEIRDNGILGVERITKVNRRRRRDRRGHLNLNEQKNRAVCRVLTVGNAVSNSARRGISSARRIFVRNRVSGRHCVEMRRVEPEIPAYLIGRAAFHRRPTGHFGLEADHKLIVGTNRRGYLHNRRIGKINHRHNGRLFPRTPNH